MSEARREILRRLGRPTEAIDASAAPWPQRAPLDDQVASFTDALVAAGGSVVRVDDLQAARSAVGGLLAEAGARSVVVEDHPHLAAISVPTGIELTTVASEDPGLRARCAAADAGVSTAEGAVAETGSIVIASGPGRSRLATLLPPLHVAVVDAGRMTRDLFSWAAARDGELPANLTFVSGPSKTGDIEQTMAIGVHGPKRFVVVLYG